jgi:hypothetical protein
LKGTEQEKAKSSADEAAMELAKAFENADAGIPEQHGSSESALEIPAEPKMTAAERKEQELADLLSIICDNEALVSMGLDNFILKGGPHVSEVLKPRGVTNMKELKTFVKDSDNKSKIDLANAITTALRKLAAANIAAAS